MCSGIALGNGPGVHPSWYKARHVPEAFRPTCHVTSIVVRMSNIVFNKLLSAAPNRILSSVGIKKLCSVSIKEVALHDNIVILNHGFHLTKCIFKF